MEIRQQAREWAREILATRLDPESFSLELCEERIRAQQALGRQLYQVSFRVWEAAGRAEVSIELRTGRITRVRYPVGPIELDPEGPWEGDASSVEAVALAKVTEARGDAPVRVSAVLRLVAPRGESRALVHVERAAPDGVLVVEIDPRAGTREGFQCLPFLRGSTRSGALTRRTAVARARAALDLPPKSRLAYSKLTTRGRRRLWRFRWDVRTENCEGWIKAAVNARTGALCEFSRALCEVSTLSTERSDRAEAVRAIRLAAALRFDESATVGGVVPGAVPCSGELIAGWLAVVSWGAIIVRATYARSRVRFGSRRVQRPA